MYLSKRKKKKIEWEEIRVSGHWGVLSLPKYRSCTSPPADVAVTSTMRSNSERIQHFDPFSIGQIAKQKKMLYIREGELLWSESIQHPRWCYCLVPNSICLSFVCTPGGVYLFLVLKAPFFCLVLFDGSHFHQPTKGLCSHSTFYLFFFTHVTKWRCTSFLSMLKARKLHRYSLCVHIVLSLQTIPKLHSEPVIPPGRLSLIAQLLHFFFFLKPASTRLSQLLMAFVRKLV